MNKKLWLPTVVLTVLGVAGSANAHMIETNYLLPGPASSSVTTRDAEGTALKITATFSTGEPYANAKIEIFAPGNDEQPWRVAQADEQGRYNFVPDAGQPGEWTINIGEDSHWDSLTVPVQTTGDGISYGEISNAEPVLPPNAIAIGAITTLAGLGYGALHRNRQR